MPTLFNGKVSTVHLSLVRFELFSDTATSANLGLFTLAFTVFRILLGPQLWWSLQTTAWDHRENPTSQACLPWHFKYVVFVFGIFFNCLNAFWFYKIVRKMYRKIVKTEQLKAKMQLGKDD